MQVFCACLALSFAQTFAAFALCCPLLGLWSCHFNVKQNKRVNKQTNKELNGNSERIIRLAVINLCRTAMLLSVSESKEMCCQLLPWSRHTTQLCSQIT